MSKLSAVAWAIVFTAPMQAATMSASITAYSTAVGPSSSRKQFFEEIEHDKSLNLREAFYFTRRRRCIAPTVCVLAESLAYAERNATECPKLARAV